MEPALEFLVGVNSRLTRGQRQVYRSKEMRPSPARLSGTKGVIVLLTLAALSFGVTESGPRSSVVTANPLIGIASTTLSAWMCISKDHAGDEVRFLLARDSAGRVRAAFDACKRCYMYHEGYDRSHGKLICRFCGNHYKLDAMESGLASCVPIKLPYRLSGQTVEIERAELERERYLFER